jgi:D-alanyl-D-alanine carboxypeptidase/D-alanyl-D-alanine-endopeptidase (penicillin-binding protein 4)
MKTINFSRCLFLILTFEFLLSSCSVSKQISKSAKETVLTNKALTNAHVGISIFDPAENKYLYNFQGDKYFVPASNTKLPTCYAAMKYLGDSLIAGWMLSTDTAILIIPNGDPTLLHPDFPTQPLIAKLKNTARHIYITDANWKEEALGSGWAWNDYDQYYMAERSPLPVYGNVITWIQEKKEKEKPPFIYSMPEINWEVNFSESASTGSR